MRTSEKYEDELNGNEKKNISIRSLVLDNELYVFYF